jgi:hypothetical protein
MIRFPKSNSLSFLVPAGTYPAICYCVAELGTQQTAYGKKAHAAHRLGIAGAAVAGGRPADVNRRYNVSAGYPGVIQTDPVDSTRWKWHRRFCFRNGDR